MANVLISDNDKKFIDFISEEQQRYKEFHRDVFDKAQKAVDHYNCVPPKRDQEWQNRVVVPVTVEGVQTISPRLFTALFPNDAPLDVLVEGKEDPQQGIKIKYLLQHHFRVANVQGEFSPGLDQCTLLGTAYFDAGSWLVNYGYQYDDKGNRYRTPIESRPDFRFIDFFEMFPHPAKIRVGDGLPLIRRRLCDAEFIKSLAENPFFQFDKLQEALNTDNPEPRDGVKPREEYEFMEYYGPKKTFSNIVSGMAVKEEKVSDNAPWWAIVINRKVIVRSIPNPYNHQTEPFAKIKLFNSIRPSWFGIGIGQIGNPTQERLNKLVNQRLNNVDLVLDRSGLINANDPMIKKEQWKGNAPGKWRDCSDVNTSAKWMDTPDVTASSYKEEELAKNDYREATGATPYLMPAEVGEQHRTAMGIQLLQGAAGTRFRPVLRLMEIDGIQQIAMFFFSNLKQFMTNEEWVLITGDNGTTKPILVSPEDIKAKVFFIPTGISETVNKEIQVGQLLRYKEVTMGDPTVNRQEINKRIAEIMGFKDINKLLTPIQMPQRGNLGTNEQMIVQQRLAEGASPEQIKQELLGPAPYPTGQNAPQPEGGQGGQG